MAVYKIPQDVEADDKFVGPLSFKQFIYGGIAAVCIYLSFLAATRGFAVVIVLFAPIIIVAGFLAFPWSREQSTEVWLAAKIRFMIKPRVRIWNQSGVKELVSVTAPVHIVKNYTDGLTVNEVSNRLTGLADLLDSRGWAVKNVGASTFSPIIGAPLELVTDRLVEVAPKPAEVTEITAADDILDVGNNQTAIHFEEMIKNSEEKHRKEVLSTLDSARIAPQNFSQSLPTANQNTADFWFLQKGGAHPTDNGTGVAEPGFTTFNNANVVTPSMANQPNNMPYQAPVRSTITPEAEQALLNKIHNMHEKSSPYGHLKTIQPLSAHGMAGDNTVTTQIPPASSAPIAPVIDPAVSPQSAVTNPVPSPTNSVLTPDMMGAYEAYAKTLADQKAGIKSTPAGQPNSTYVPPKIQTYQPPKPVTPPVDPAIMNLASNNDLNVATLARQAHKKSADGEVTISLR